MDPARLGERVSHGPGAASARTKRGTVIRAMSPGRASEAPVLCLFLPSSAPSTPSRRGPIVANVRSGDEHGVRTTGLARLRSNQAAFGRYVRAADRPVVVAQLIFIPVVLVPLFVDAGPT